MVSCARCGGAPGAVFAFVFDCCVGGQVFPGLGVITNLGYCGDSDVLSPILVCAFICYHFTCGC